MKWPLSSRSRLIVLLTPAALMGVWLVSDWAWRVITQVDLQALGNFDFDQTGGTVADVPRWIRKLDGRRIAVEGYMYSPQVVANESKEVQIVYNVSGRRNRRPLVQERICGHLPPRTSIPIFDQFTFARVSGVFHVRVVKDEAGAIHSVFDLDVERAEALGAAALR